MTPLANAARPAECHGLSCRGELGRLELPIRSALVDAGSLSRGMGRDVETARFEDLSGGVAGALFSGVALVAAAALLLALVVPWLSPLKRRTP